MPIQYVVTRFTSAVHFPSSVIRLPKYTHIHLLQLLLWQFNLEEQELEQVNEFMYLGSLITEDGYSSVLECSPVNQMLLQP